MFTGSWKTTSAGLLLIIGGLVRLGFAIKAGALTEESIMSTVTGIIGGIGMLVARDNDKSSEAVGADPLSKAVRESANPPKDSTNRLNSILLWVLCGFLSFGLLLSFSGCQTSPAKTIVNVSDASRITVEAALSAWDSYIKLNHPPLTQQAAVRKAWQKYQRTQLFVLDAAIVVKVSSTAGGDPAAAHAQLNRAIAEASTALADLIQLLRTCGVKL